ncbi:MAG: ABC transporter substrate-binding protein [Pyrinomonadaceae bacterium]
MATRAGLKGRTPHADLLRDIEGADQLSGFAESSINSFGAHAVDDFTLRVRLVRPNANFPNLVTHTVFRPVHRADSDLTVSPSAHIVTNGAFQFHEATRESVTLARAPNYWDAERVQLSRVKFLNAPDTEEALALYRAGEIDAVTNANLEPLAVKLLSPYRDFRRSTFGALVYYEFNLRHQFSLIAA